MRSIVLRLQSVTAKSLWSWRARLMNSSTAGDGGESVLPSGTGSGASQISCSPGRRSVSRLVAIVMTPGQACSSVGNSAIASIMDSALSSTSSRSCPRRASMIASALVVSWPEVRPMWRAMASHSEAASSRSSWRKSTPWAKPHARRCAAVSARRVLPTPPGPSRETTRESRPSRSRSTIARSLSRPTSGFAGRGGGWRLGMPEIPGKCGPVNVSIDDDDRRRSSRSMRAPHVRSRGVTSVSSQPAKPVPEMARKGHDCLWIPRSSYLIGLAS